MKVLSLNKTVVNIQRCLLPDCKFLRENYGRYSVVTKNGWKFIVKIGLCDVKYLDSAIFLDDSVSVFSSFEQIQRKELLNDITFDNFNVINKPLIGKTVRVIVVFADIFDARQYKNNENILKKVVRDLLKLFVFCNNSLLYLSNLLANQRFGINCIIITNVDKPNEIFRIDSNTEIIIENCISQLGFNQLFKKENELKVGGCSRVFEILKETIQFLRCIDNKKGKLVNKLLLIGPTGCGKTTLVRSVTSECKCILLEISASDINLMTPERVEKKLETIFEQAKTYGVNNDCCVILIEDIDIISSGRNYHARKFVGKLTSLLDESVNASGILVIATTNSPDNVEQQLRRPKRLEDELEIMIPGQEERAEILENIFNYCNVHYSKNLVEQVALWTPGFVGADLRLLVLEALLLANKQKGSLNESDDVTFQGCFKEALKKVIPSALKGAVGLCWSKSISFSDIGGLENIKRILHLSVKEQLENPAKFEKLGIPLTKGILLYGPPGCAKTTLVKALAKECNATFLATSAADLYSPFVGDAEKKIVQLFTQARMCSPSILFIDEIDAVVGSKSGDRERGVQERILSTLLLELDGVGLKINTHRDNSLKILGSKETFPEKPGTSRLIVIGATNRPQLLDDALKRPGRFDRLLYVPPPNEGERLRILGKLTEKLSLHDSVDIKNLAKVTNYYSGADLKNLCQESGLHALHSSSMAAESIHQCHFEHVLSGYKPSLNEKVIAFYESFQKFNA